MCRCKSKLLHMQQNIKIIPKNHLIFITTTKKKKLFKLILNKFIFNNIVLKSNKHVYHICGVNMRCVDVVGVGVLGDVCRLCSMCMVVNPDGL